MKCSMEMICTRDQPLLSRERGVRAEGLSWGRAVLVGGQARGSSTAWGSVSPLHKDGEDRGHFPGAAQLSCSPGCTLRFPE